MQRAAANVSMIGFSHMQEAQPQSEGSGCVHGGKITIRQHKKQSEMCSG
jgi:hypothetical protein